MTKVRRWHKVSLAEVREILDACQRAGTIYNGCTHATLRQRYGAANVRHVMGRGWYKLVAR